MTTPAVIEHTVTMESGRLTRITVRVDGTTVLDSAETERLRAEVGRLRLAYTGLAAAMRELTGMSSLGIAAEATGTVTPAQRAAIDALNAP